MNLPPPTLYDLPEVANSYDQHFRRRVDRAEDAAIDRILGDLSRRDVLDLGCGTCALLDRHHPRTYLGVDSSQAMIATALRKHCTRFRDAVDPNGMGEYVNPDRRYVIALGDACEDPATWVPALGPATPGKRYDVAVSLFALSYFPDLVSALTTAWDMLRPGGDLILHAYTRRYLRRRHCLDHGDAHTPVHPYTSVVLQELARKTGFVDVDVRGFRYLPDPIANLLPVATGQRLARTAANVLPAAPAMTLILTARKLLPAPTSVVIPLEDRRLGIVGSGSRRRGGRLLA